MSHPPVRPLGAITPFRARSGDMESLKEVFKGAGALPEGAKAAIDGGVDVAVARLSKTVAVVAEASSDYVSTGRAHAEVASARLGELEDRAFAGPTATLSRAVAEAPYATGAAAASLALLLLPASRRLLWRATLGRASSEEAIFNACNRGAETLRANAEASAKELKRLRDAAATAEVEMLRGQSKLRQAAAELKRLVRDRTPPPRHPSRVCPNTKPRPAVSRPTTDNSRRRSTSRSTFHPFPTPPPSDLSPLTPPSLFHSSSQGGRNARDERFATDVLDDLRSLPSKQALGLRDEVATTAAQFGKVRSGVDGALRKIYRAGVAI